MGASTKAATRRELIARAVSRGRGDVGALVALVRAEQVLLASYEQALGAGVLSPPAVIRAREFLLHERAHVAAVSRALEHLGGTVPTPPPTLSAALAPASERVAVRVLLELERAALSAYYAESMRLRDPAASRVAAEIMACGAQHTTELRELLSPGDVMRAVPSAFVFGTP